MFEWWRILGAGHRETLYIHTGKRMYRSSLVADSVHFANMPPGKEVFVPSRFIFAVAGSHSAGLRMCREVENWELPEVHMPTEAEHGEAGL